MDVVPSDATLEKEGNDFNITDYINSLFPTQQSFEGNNIYIYTYIHIYIYIHTHISYCF